MTHTAEHVIIHSLTDTVSFGAPAIPPKPSKVRVWHLGLALLVAGFLLGLAF